MSPGTFFDLPSFGNLFSWLPSGVVSVMMVCLLFLAAIAIKRMVV